MNTPTTPTTNTMWWYARKQQKFGPYTEAQLHELARVGDVQANDLIWNNKLDDWVAANSIDSLVFGAPQMNPTPDENAQLHATSESSATVEKTDTQENNQQKYLTLFVGTNQEFYLRNWEKNENMFSWNWAAFCLGLFWLAYRKMYWACAILVGLVTIAIGTALQLKIPVETIKQWQPYFVISFSIALGLFGNRLYLFHAKQKIQQINNQYPSEDVLKELKRQGGGSMMSILHVLAAILVLSMLLGFLFDK